MNVYRKFPEENNKNPNSTTKSGFQQNENKKEIKEINIKIHVLCSATFIYAKAQQVATQQGSCVKNEHSYLFSCHV